MPRNDAGRAGRANRLWQVVSSLALCLLAAPAHSAPPAQADTLDASLNRFKRLVGVEKVADFEIRWRAYIDALHKSKGDVRLVLMAGGVDPAADWPMDRLTLADGTVYCGQFRGHLDDGRVNFLEVVRRPGFPLYFQARWFGASQVQTRDDLSAAERRRLQELIDKYKNRREYETLDKKKLLVKLGKRTDDFGRKLATYRSDNFELESTADTDTTVTAIVRIDERVKAYRKLLPPRIEPKRPLRVLLLASTNEYQIYLERVGMRVANPAYYDEQQNLVVAVTDQGTLNRKWKEAEQHNASVEQKLKHDRDQFKAALAADSKLFQQLGANSREIKGLTQQRLKVQQEQIDDLERALKECERRNQRKYDEAVDQMFRTVYHEAFHAYLANYVYDPATHEVPRWLNEGLAQVFEGGLLEAGTLRIDAPDRDKLNRLWADLQRPDALTLIEVFRAQPEVFLGMHRSVAQRGADGPATATAAAERYYLYSWGMAHFLAFEQKALGTPGMDAFLERR